MLNPIASEAMFSATYVDNYIDSVENLPDDVQRQLSRIRDIDVKYRSHLLDVDHYYDLWKALQNSGDSSASRRARAIARMQQSLIQAQELGDEKMHIVNQLQELIDHKTRQLDSDQKNLDIKEEQQQNDLQCLNTPHKIPRTQSPTREVKSENISVNGSHSGESGVCKEQQVYGVYSGNAVSSANGASTPSSDRSGHSNSNGAQLGTNYLVTGGQAIVGTINQSGSECHRSGSKRSRRRNEAANPMEVCGNESNSANEAGSNGGTCGSDKNNVGISGGMSQKQLPAGGSSNASQKKNTVQGQVGASTGSVGTVPTGGGGIGSSTSGGNSGKKKKRKARGTQAANAQNTREETPPPDPIDPDEPTYCLCDQISFGEMILCDNDLCPIEWFHFSCVSLVLKPKGKWYCPNCRGDRPNVMKPKAQFLKELERYNKEKEEKT